MARFRNTVSGVVVSVDSEAPMLPGSWEPYEEPTGETKKTTARKRPSRKTETESAPAANSDAAGTDDE